MKQLLRKSLAALLALGLAFTPVAAHAVSDIQDYSTTAATNTDIGGVNFAEAMLPGLVNNGVRELIAQLKRAIANRGTAISSAATTNICATGTSIFAHVTGTTTITSFGTAAAGCTRLVVFDGILTLTHNAVSLILPSGANITTAANDNALAVSEGSGSWRVLFYETASGGVVGGFSSVTATSADAGAGAGPAIITNRNSASPAANDLIGQFRFDGRDSASNAQTYCSIVGKIVDPTSTSEDAETHFQCVNAGTLAARMIVGQGVQIGAAPTGGDCGAGCVNADSDIQLDGVSIVHGIAQVVRASSATYTTAATDMPLDDSIPQITEGDEILSVAITPKSASSIIRIRAKAFVGASSVGSGGMALFVDATAGALAATAFTVAGTASHADAFLEHTLTAGSLTARTYRIRIGPSVGGPVSIRVNGDSAARVFGGVAKATIEVEEILP